MHSRGPTLPSKWKMSWYPMYYTTKTLMIYDKGIGPKCAPDVILLIQQINCPFVKNFHARFDFTVKLKNEVLNLYSEDYLNTKTIAVGEHSK